MGHRLCKICGTKSPRSGTSRRTRNRVDRRRSADSVRSPLVENNDDESAAVSRRRQRASRAVSEPSSRSTDDGSDGAMSSQSSDTERSRSSGEVGNTVNEPYHPPRRDHRRRRSDSCSTRSSFSHSSGEPSDDDQCDEEESETRKCTGSSGTFANRVGSRSRSVTLSDLSATSEATSDRVRSPTGVTPPAENREPSDGSIARGSSQRHPDRLCSHAQHETCAANDSPLRAAAAQPITTSCVSGLVVHAAESTDGPQTSTEELRGSTSDSLVVSAREASERYPHYWNEVLSLQAVVDMIAEAEAKESLMQGPYAWPVQRAAALASAVPLVQWWDYCVCAASKKEVRAPPSSPQPQQPQRQSELTSQRGNAAASPLLHTSPRGASGREFRDEHATTPYLDPALLRRCRAAWERAAMELPHHSVRSQQGGWVQSVFPGNTTAFRERYRQSFYHSQETTSTRRSSASSSSSCRGCPRCRSCCRHVRRCVLRNHEATTTRGSTEAATTTLLHSDFDENAASARNASALGCRILATPSRTLSVFRQGSLEPPEDVMESGWLSYDAVADVLTDFAPDWVSVVDRVVEWLAALPGLLDQVAWLQPSLDVDRFPSCLQLWCRPRRLPCPPLTGEGSTFMQSLRETFEWLLIQQQETSILPGSRCSPSFHSQRIVAHCAKMSPTDDGVDKHITNFDAAAVVGAICLIFSAVGPEARCRLLESRGKNSDLSEMATRQSTRRSHQG